MGVALHQPSLGSDKRQLWDTIFDFLENFKVYLLFKYLLPAATIPCKPVSHFYCDSLSVLSTFERLESLNTS